MGVTLGNVADGTAMSWTAISSEITTVTEWLQGVTGPIGSGDFAVASLRTEDVYRPELYDWPIQGIVGQFQSGYTRTHGLAEDRAGFAAESKFERVAIPLRSMDISDLWRVAHSAKTLNLNESSEVEVNIHLEYVLSYNSALAAAYPTAAGAGDEGGFFAIATFQRDVIGASPPETVRTTSRRSVYPGGSIAIPADNLTGMHCSEVLEWTGTLGAGEWDIYLVFGLDTPTANYLDIYAISVLRINSVVEVHRG